MTAPTYQYVDLPDASIVTTRALLTARENIADTVAARAMMCDEQVVGEAGGGLLAGQGDLEPGPVVVPLPLGALTLTAAFPPVRDDRVVQQVTGLCDGGLIRLAGRAGYRQGHRYPQHVGQSALVQEGAQGGVLTVVGIGCHPGEGQVT
nr:hypothetical protein OG296_37000 [Streptomyces sp. NBC_01001]